ncbi:MAG: helix-turn-helix transcriptional regulator [Anaerolineae bacterium]|nr:helix-turn-helix transcriptional regulator [Anaerolineae bacterium]
MTFQTTTPTVDKDRIKGLRVGRAMRAEEVARRAGISTAQVYRLENGERPNATAVTMARIAQALGTSVEYLLGMTDDVRSVKILTRSCHGEQEEPSRSPDHWKPAMP